MASGMSYRQVLTDAVVRITRSLNMTFSASGEIVCLRPQTVSCSITDNKVKSDYSYKKMEVSKYFDILQNLIMEHARKA